MGERDTKRKQKVDRQRRCHEHDQALRSGTPLESKDVQDELQGGFLVPLGFRPLSKEYWFSTISIFNHACMCACIFAYACLC